MGNAERQHRRLARLNRHLRRSDRLERDQRLQPQRQHLPGDQSRLDRRDARRRRQRPDDDPGAAGDRRLHERESTLLDGLDQAGRDRRRGAAPCSSAADLGEPRLEPLTRDASGDGDAGIRADLLPAGRSERRLERGYMVVDLGRAYWRGRPAGERDELDGRRSQARPTQDSRHRPAWRRCHRGDLLVWVWYTGSWSYRATATKVSIVTYYRNSAGTGSLAGEPVAGRTSSSNLANLPRQPSGWRDSDQLRTGNCRNRNTDNG